MRRMPDTSEGHDEPRLVPLVDLSDFHSAEVSDFRPAFEKERGSAFVARATSVRPRRRHRRRTGMVPQTA